MQLDEKRYALLALEVQLAERRLGGYIAAMSNSKGEIANYSKTYIAHQRGIINRCNAEIAGMLFEQEMSDAESEKAIEVNRFAILRDASYLTSAKNDKGGIHLLGHLRFRKFQVLLTGKQLPSSDIDHSMGNDTIIQDPDTGEIYYTQERFLEPCE